METFLDGGNKERCTHHIFGRHPQELLTVLRDADENYEELIQTCPICSRKGMNLASHVYKSHGMLWSDFAQKYNWQTAGHICLEKTKQILSNQKISYYNSERGAARKRLQSEQMSGDKNVSKRDEVRRKISRSCMGRKISQALKDKNSFRTSERLQSGELQPVSYGYFFQWIHNGKYYYARSYEEFKVLYSLIANNVEFQIEPCIISYEVNGEFKNYVPDVQIGELFYEIKPNVKCFEVEKYDAVKASLSKVGKKLLFLNASNLKDATGYNCVAKVDLENYIRENVNSSNMTILLPSTKANKKPFALLKKIFGEGFQQILESKREKFYENKKLLCS